jgi:hypothetical protein
LEAALGTSVLVEMAHEWMQVNLPLLQDESFVTEEVVAEHLVDFPYCYPCVAG